MTNPVVDAMQRRHCRQCGEKIPEHRQSNARYCTERCRRDSDRENKQAERGPGAYEVLHPDAFWPARRVEA